MGYKTHGRGLWSLWIPRKNSLYSYKRKAKQKVTVHSTTEISGLCDAGEIFVT